MNLFNKKKETSKNDGSEASCLPKIGGQGTGGSVRIKILGSGCAKCRALEKSVRATLEELHLEAAIDDVTDFSQIAAYGVMTTPALVVDNVVVSYGKVLKTEEAKGLIAAARKKSE